MFLAPDARVGVDDGFAVVGDAGARRAADVERRAGGEVLRFGAGDETAEVGGEVDHAVEV